MRAAGYPDAENGASAKRLLTADLRLLKDRGLVTSAEYVDDHGTSGVQFVKERNVKSAHLQLTRAEHALLVHLRRTYKPNEMVAALPTGESDGATEAERLFQIIRLLEEHDREMPFEELRAYLGCSTEDLDRWLEWVSEVYTDFSGGPGLECVYLDSEDDAPGRKSGAVLVRPSRATGNGTLRHTGLDLLGLFPYSLPEAAERLDLVDRALADAAGGRDAERREALETISYKLSEWCGILQQSRGEPWA